MVITYSTPAAIAQPTALPIRILTMFRILKSITTDSIKIFKNNDYLIRILTFLLKEVLLFSFCLILLQPEFIFLK